MRSNKYIKLGIEFPDQFPTKHKEYLKLIVNNNPNKKLKSYQIGSESDWYDFMLIFENSIGYFKYENVPNWGNKYTWMKESSLHKLDIEPLEEGDMLSIYHHIEGKKFPAIVVERQEDLDDGSKTVRIKSLEDNKEYWAWFCSSEHRWELGNENPYED